MPKSLKIALIIMGVLFVGIPFLIFLFGMFFINSVKAQSTLKGKVSTLGSLIFPSNNGKGDTKSGIKIIDKEPTFEKDWTMFITSYELKIKPGTQGKITAIKNVYQDAINPKHKIGDVIVLIESQISSGFRDFPIILPSDGEPTTGRVVYLEMEQMLDNPQGKGVIEYTVEVPLNAVTIYRQVSHVALRKD